MSRRPPRLLVHRGVVDAAGLFLDAGLCGEAEARRRVLALWRPGTRVQRGRSGRLVLFAGTTRLRCDAAPGLPLVVQPLAEGSALTGSPLSRRELEALAPEPGQVVLARAGGWHRERLEGESEDPAAWLEVEGFAVAPVASLGLPPEPMAVLPPPAPALDLRSRLAGIPPSEPQVNEVLAAARKAQAAAGGRGLPAGRWTGLRRLLARLVFASPLAGVIGRRYAAYVRRMVQMFESGDISSALRHAIPLDSSLRATPAPRGLFLPAPRADLTIRPGAVSAASASPLDLYQDLQRLYRQTFQRLEGQGRIDEAAFLLAEILRCDEEAVAFLERHGRLRLAAEMAEARRLAPGLVVRQWFLAGERGHAIRVARRTGAFDGAVLHLERTGHRKEARELRLLWAAALADAGDYAAAVEVVEPVPEARHLALAWIDRAIALGGEVAGRMLARKVAVLPQPFAPLRAAVLELLESSDLDGAAARSSFAQALAKGPKLPEAQVLARAAVRSLVRDSALGSAYRIPLAELRRLAELAEDGALRTDLAHLQMRSPKPWQAGSGVLSLVLEANDAGAMPAYDAAFLPDGRLAVALGEAGVRLIGRSGRTVGELAEPAYRLVVSDHGDRAIALAWRGESVRLARLDFRELRSESWTEARIDCHATDYDGAVWYVAGEQGVVAVDVAGRRFDGSWGVSDLPGPVAAIARSATHLSFWIGGFNPEVWTYQLPSLTLRSRSPSCEPEGPIDQAVLPAGEVVQAELRVEEWVRLRLPGGRESSLPLEGSTGFQLPLYARGSWLALGLKEPEGLRVVLIGLADGVVRGRFVLRGSERAVLRLSRDALVIADDLGRVLVVDLGHGRLLRNLRL